MSEPLTSSKTSQFIQRGSGKAVEYLGGCWDTDSIPTSVPGHDPIICKQNGKLTVAGKSQTPPELITTTITGLLYETATYLDKLSESGCKFNYFELQGCNEGVFRNNPFTGSALADAEIMGGEKANPVQREADDPITLSREIDALPPRFDVWQMFSSQLVTTETEDINTIAAYPGNCAGDCGDVLDVCEALVAGCDAAAGLTANVLLTQNFGVTWATTAADPFAADENIIAIRAFRLDGDTIRIFAVRDGDAADNLEGAYSDDNGATWTMVDIGVTNNEAATTHYSLFVLNAANMWVCTDDGRVFKSTDSGATWTDQASALTASGANPLNAIKFINSNIGYAVGNADTIIFTQNGGGTWTAATATGGGNNLLTLEVHNRYRVSTGDDGGDHYMTYDGTANWTLLNNFTGAGGGSVAGIDFINDLFGYMIAVNAAGDGYIHRTINGGYSWERIGNAFGTNGLNGMVVCSRNHVFAVGDDDGTTGIILESGMNVA